MAESRAAALGWEEARALGAATAPQSLAARDWCELMGAMPFDEIAETTQRVMPAIFQNLRGVPDLPERDRMRGAFKHMWSKTTELLHGVRGVLQSLDAAGIDYRVLKGAAVQAVCGSIGSRAMGDVDLLVAPDDVDRVIATLATHGFRRGTVSECPGHSTVTHGGSLDFNNGSCHVDVHVAGHKEPKRLMSLMMATPGRRIRAAGTDMLVPPVELLVLHAAVHGSSAVGPSDFVQAVVDISMLAPQTDRRRLLAAAQRTGTLVPLLDLAAATRAIGGNDLGVDIPMATRVRARVGSALGYAAEATMSASSVGRRIRTRRRAGAALAVVDRDFVGSRYAYRSWLRLGQFAVVERAAVRGRGGFLPRPSSAWVSGASVQPFAAQHSGNRPVTGLTASTVADSALDWRFRLRLPGPQRWVRITLASPTLDRFDTFVFCNGVPMRRTVAGDPSTRDLVLRDVGEDLEVSLRALWPVCSACFRDLDDLEVTIALGDDAKQVAA